MAQFNYQEPNRMQSHSDISNGDGINLTQKEQEVVNTMTGVTYASIEDLAFVHWQYKANEKAYAAKLITRGMYEFAREELLKAIDSLEKVCYNTNSSKVKAGESNGFIENKAAT